MSERPLRGFADWAAVEQRRVEARFSELVDPERLRGHLHRLSRVPHHAGSEAGRDVALDLLGQFRAWGLEAAIEEFDALVPQPLERVVELIGPIPFRALLAEPPIPGDETSAAPNQLPPFAAYSADGDVTAPLVYVNYGVPADYERLAAEGIDVRGKIVIARYGGTLFRGLKPKTAAEWGAVGCLIYSDPKDDGYFQAPAYPEGPSRPAHGVQRGSTYFMPIQNGDPLAVWGDPDSTRRIERADARDLMPVIPVQPLSYADALPLLTALEGPVAPDAWRGALPITYRLGPGPGVVRLVVRQSWETRRLHDVIARIEGAERPDQWVLRGNHHDAWVHGATDPGSGNMTLLETARVLGQMVREGWRPARTIVLASWDGEELGLIGSSEWARRHATLLSERCVAYLNTDLTGREWLTAGGSHSLQALVTEAATDVAQPGVADSVADAARAHAGETDPAAPLPLYPLGAETDYAAFLGRLGIASLDLWFDGGWQWRGVYHSSYDSYDWYLRFGDPTFAYGKALTETTGTILLRLAAATVVPFEFGGLAGAVRRYAAEIEATRAAEPAAPPLEWGPLERAARALDGAAGEWGARGVRG